MLYHQTSVLGVLHLSGATFRQHITFYYNLPFLNPKPPDFVFADEVGALVFDIGSYSVRAGYAGEDCPKVSGSLMFSLTVRWIFLCHLLAPLGL